MNSPTVELVTFLRERLPDGVTVSSTLDGWTQGLLWVRVTRSGGSPDPDIEGANWLRHPRFNIDVYGTPGDNDAAEDLAEQAYTALALVNSPEHIVWAHVSFTDVIIDEPAYVPDPVDLTTPHFNFIAGFTAHPVI